VEDLRSAQHVGAEGVGEADRKGISGAVAASVWAAPLSPRELAWSNKAYSFVFL
jgi:hypothetical protein